MNETIKRGVKKTLQYAAYFDFPLTPEEIHRWLVTSRRVTQKQVALVLTKLKDPNLICWWTKKLTPKRLKRHEYSLQKKELAQKVATVIARIPTVKLVALTGSAAIGNASKKDDIDLMIVTDENTLWLTRPLVILLVGLYFKRRKPGQKENLANVVCLNLWLDQKALMIPVGKQNVYTAHEIMQIVPLIDKNHTYYSLILANFWVTRFLANAYGFLRAPLQGFKQDKTNNHTFVKAFNRLMYWGQLRYMKSKMTQELVGEHFAFFHPKDWSADLNNALGE